MATKETKKYKRDEVVLTAVGKKIVKTDEGFAEIPLKFEVTPHSFATINFKGMTVTGEAYYVDKAVGLGAKKG